MMFDTTFVGLSIAAIIPIFSNKLYDLICLDTDADATIAQNEKCLDLNDLILLDTDADANRSRYQDDKKAKDVYNTKKSMAMIFVGALFVIFGSVLWNAYAVSFGTAFGGFALILFTVIKNWHLHGLGMQVSVLGVTLLALIMFGFR